MCENDLHEYAWWLTLTYDDEHLPRSSWIDSDGVIHDVATLRKKDLQDFMKRLREAYRTRFFEMYPDYKDPVDPPIDYIPPWKLRFFGCGEYGDKSGRPHYHVIIFGLDLPDKAIYKRTAPQKGGFLLYNSDFVTRAWSLESKDDDDKKIYKPIGHVVIAEVTWESCAYTARYMLKKQKGDGAFIYDMMNIEPEFTCMSLKPGIGRQYYELHKDKYHTFHEFNLSTEKDGHKVRNVAYFDKIFAVEDEIEYNIYKQQKQDKAVETMQQKLANTNLSYPELLKIEERNKKNAIQALKREL